MTTKANALMQAASLSLLLMIVPGIAASQGQQEPAAPQPEQATQKQESVSAGTVTVPQPAASREGQAAPAAATPAPAGPQEYTVRQGDTLWDISNAFYRDPFLWPVIWKANPSITNPDLIYAGNKVEIPSLAPIERAMEAPAPAPAPLVEKKTAPAAEAAPAAPAEQRPQEEMAEAPAQQQAAPAPAEEKAPAMASQFVAPEEKPIPVTDKYALLSAGFVNDLDTTDMVMGSPEAGKTIFGFDDIVYIKFANRDAVNVGDKFLVYAPLQKVKHPITGQPYGQLERGLAIVQITAKDPEAEYLTGHITISFDSVEVKDLVTPYQEPVLVYQSREKKAKDISGYILEVPDTRNIMGQFDIVYLDKGKNDGVDPGDRFTVYREPEKKGFPKKQIGEVQVFLVKDRTATALVRRSTDTLARGNIILFKQ